MKLYAKINSGAAGLVWVAGFFIIVILIAVSSAIERQCIAIITGWTGGLVTILFKKNADNKLDLEAAKEGQSTVVALDQIKMNAAASTEPG